MRFARLARSLFYIIFLFIVACGGGGNGGNSNRGDTSAPIVNISYPVEGAQLLETEKIEWVTIDANISIVTISLSNDGGNSFIEIAKDIRDEGFFQWKTFSAIENPYEEKDGTNFVIQIVATDIADNISAPAVSGVFSIKNAPTLVGPAHYYNTNANSAVDSGDELILTFDKNIAINGASSNDFVMPVTSNSLGANPLVSFGPNSNQLTIRLGLAAHFRATREFDINNTTENAPSGIAINLSVQPDAIESLTTGTDANGAEAVDIVAGLVPTTRMDLSDTQAIGSSDIDRDGDPDVIFINNGVHTYWFNQGNGIFTQLTNSSIPISTDLATSIVIGEYEDDTLASTLKIHSIPEIFIGTNGKGIQVVQARMSGANLSVNQLSQTNLAAITTNIQALDLVDLDNDGDLDLVVGNLNADNTIWENDVAESTEFRLYSKASITLNSNGSLISPDRASIASRALATGDIDKDGDVDIVVGNFNQPNEIWFNQLNETGTRFLFEVISFGNEATTSVALGDIDQDGDVDIAVGNEGINNIWINDANVFSSSVVSNEANQTQAIALGDMNSDGFLDIVTANIASANRIWINMREAGFSKIDPSLETNDSSALLLQDLNNDAGLDVVFVNSALENSVWLNSISAARGLFPKFEQLSLPIELGLKYVRSVAFGDVNNNGKMDIAISKSSSTFDTQSKGTTIWEFANGTLTQILQNTPIDLPSFIQRNSLADIDRDGDLDLIIAGSDPAGGTVPLASVWKNNGAGQFTVSTDALNSPANASIINPTDLGIGDFNRDGWPDLAFTSFNISTATANSIWLNSGTGNYVLTNNFSSAPSQSMAIGDYNRDGYPDIVVGTTAAIPTVVMANEIGDVSNTDAFLEETQVNLSASPSTNGIAWSDITNNGRLELIIAGSGVQTYQITGSLGTTYSAMTQTTLSTVATTINDVAVGDLNNDGYPDLVLGHLESAKTPGMANSIWLNDGNGMFSETSQPNLAIVANKTFRVELADIDQDGDRSPS